jgi:hypothetical protein
MNRYLTQFPLMFEKKVVSVFAKVTFGASGAPTLTTTSSKGIVSVTRNSAGTFTFLFGTKAGMLDTYVKLLCIKHVFDTSGTSSAPASPSVYVALNSIATVGTSTIKIVFNAAGTATDPASGEIVYLEFILGDSTAP